MVRDLHHWVKNTLATVHAVLNATVRSSLSIPEFTRVLSSRITSLARTHALITEDQAQAASFAGLLDAELDGSRLTPRGRTGDAAEGEDSTDPNGGAKEGQRDKAEG